MTFTKFESFKDWLLETVSNSNIDVKALENETNAVQLTNIANCDPVMLMDIILSAYDSDYYFGTWDYQYKNGMLIIYE